MLRISAWEIACPAREKFLVSSTDATALMVVGSPSQSKVTILMPFALETRKSSKSFRSFESLRVTKNSIADSQIAWNSWIMLTIVKILSLMDRKRPSVSSHLKNLHSIMGKKKRMSTNVLKTMKTVRLGWNRKFMSLSFADHWSSLSLFSLSLLTGSKI